MKATFFFMQHSGTHHTLRILCGANHHSSNNY